MKTFSRLNVLMLLFLSIVLMLVEGTGYAESLEVLILEGQTGIGDPVGVRFVIDPPKAVILRVDAVGVEITSISGATAPYAIPGNYATDAEAGTLLVEGRIRASGAYISAVWDRDANDDLSAIAQVPNAVDRRHLAVFHRYRNTFQHPDVHEHFPDVLRAFKNPEVQNVLNSVVIHYFVRDPEYIRAFSPDVDASLITLLATDNGFRRLFEDEEFQGVLQEPAGIGELVGLIEAQSPPRVPKMVTIVSGDLQQGGSQTALGNPLVVLVRDQYGDPLSGVNIAFRVTSGGGSLSRPTARTNRAGRAETTLTLTSEPGIHQVEASVVGFPSLTQTFTATAACEVPSPPTPPTPTTLRMVSGNNQSGEMNESLTQPFVVGVLDQEGKPIQETPVTFAITAGNGQLSATRETTNISGDARTILTLGSDPGTYLVKASVAAKDSLNGVELTQTFTATAIAPPPLGEGSEPLLPPMYWIESNTIYYRPTGGGKEIFLEPTDGTLTGGLAIGTVGGKVYWTERTIDNRGRIQSANLDGTNVRTVKEITTVPLDIALDAMKGTLYWTSARGKIRRINVSGEGFDGNFITNLNSLKHIAFDMKTRRLYWTDRQGIWHIYTDNDTAIRRPLNKADLGEVRGIAVVDDVVYWTEKTKGGIGRVRSMHRSGKGVGLLAVTESIPAGIAVDPDGERVYWTTADGKIQSVSLTGTTIQTVVMRGVGPAAGIALGVPVVEASPAAPSISSVVSVENTLLANYPNPFNPETWIPYQLSEPADVSVSIYAVDGHLVRRLDLGHQSAGVYRSRNRAAYWDGRNAFGEHVASGLYFYRLTAGDFTATRRMLIRK